MRDSNLYIDIWNSTLSYILKGLHESFEEKKVITFQIKKDCFMSVGDRKSYTFTLKYENGITKRNGSAVGRDLQEVLKGDREFQEFAKEKFITIWLNGQFNLSLSAINI